MGPNWAKRGPHLANSGPDWENRGPTMGKSILNMHISGLRHDKMQLLDQAIVFGRSKVLGVKVLEV